MDCVGGSGVGDKIILSLSRGCRAGVFPRPVSLDRRLAADDLWMDPIQRWGHPLPGGGRVAAVCVCAAYPPACPQRGQLDVAGAEAAKGAGRCGNHLYRF